MAKENSYLSMKPYIAMHENGQIALWFNPEFVIKASMSSAVLSGIGSYKPEESIINAIM